MLKADLMAQNTKVDIEFFDGEKYKELLLKNQEAIRRILTEAMKRNNGKQVAQKQRKRSEISCAYSKDDVAELLGISDSHAYRIIRELNEELKKKGYFTIAGQVSKVYLQEKYYGLDRIVYEGTKEERR